MKNDKDRIERFVDELLAPCNQDKYQEVLNKTISDEESKLIDNYIKFWHYELKQDKAEETKEKKTIGMQFEEPKPNKPNIGQYEWKPNEEDLSELELLNEKPSDCFEEVNPLLNEIEMHLEMEEDDIVSNKIREVLLEKYKFFPLNVQEMDEFFKEKNIRLHVNKVDNYKTVYELTENGNIIVKFMLKLVIEALDEGVLLRYEIVQWK